MPWEFSQRTGELRHDGVLVYDKGYSGAGFAKNDPDMEHVPYQGPIPRGTWSIGQAQKTTKGDYTMPLSPYGGNHHGRSAFLIHGDSISSPGTASEGCIILPLPIRKRISASGDTSLHVVR